MSTLATKSYENMWQHIAHELYELSSDRYNEDIPHLRLIIAIIIQAAKDVDRDYLNSPLFVEHVNLLKIHVRYVSKVIISAWEIIDSGEVWKAPPPEIEEWDI